MSKQHEKVSKIESIYLQDLIPYEKNPRKHGKNVDELVKSIKENGWTSPIQIDQKNRIIAGHGRLLAAKRLNLSTVPCVRIECTDSEYIKLVLSDNKIAELSGWNNKLLQETMSILGDLHSVSIPGFDLEDIDKIFGHKHEDISASVDAAAAETDFGGGVKVESSQDDRALVKSKTFKLTQKEYKFVDEKLKAIKKEQGFELEVEALMYALKGFKSLTKVITKNPVKDVTNE